MPSQKKKWDLTQEALDRLLAQLGADREQAGAKLESIRRKLIKYFECQGCLAFEEYADQTIDRVAQKADTGEVIRASDPAFYFLGVARNLLKEYWRSQVKEAVVGFDGMTPLPQTVVDPKESEQEHEWLVLGEQRLKCLRQCLQNLSPEDRQSVLQYYEATGRTKISLRETLAQKFEITSNALRIRMHRRREQLEACLKNCVAQLQTE